MATPEEQEVLSRYVGWGGIPQAFEERNSAWAAEYTQLKGVLTPEEYSAARASTLNAFYTSPTVIKAMYEALGNMGLKQGNILEPSCGVGNFMGLLPESMSAASMYGVELDPVSGQIAKQLYQKNRIAVQGFEETSYPDSFFDCVIGNVPFGAYQVSDRKYDRYHFMIHDYFIAKSLDLVRPGGVVAVVTSSGTMDKQNPEVRQYFANRADLLGAIRLPNNAFQRNANTSVVADLLFFQKRDRAAITEPDWVQLKTTPEGIQSIPILLIIRKWCLEISQQKYPVRKTGSNSKGKSGSRSGRAVKRSGKAYPGNHHRAGDFRYGTGRTGSIHTGKSGY